MSKFTPYCFDILLRNSSISFSVSFEAWVALLIVCVSKFCCIAFRYRFGAQAIW